MRQHPVRRLVLGLTAPTTSLPPAAATATPGPPGMASICTDYSLGRAGAFLLHQSGEAVSCPAGEHGDEVRLDGRLLVLGDFHMIRASGRVPI